MKSNETATALLGPALAACLALALAGAADAGDAANAEQGILKCDVDGGIGLLLGSKKQMTCDFTRNDGTVEHYSGHVLKIGLDIGITKDSNITWAVIAGASPDKVGALAGHYEGVSAEATVVGGVGANVLVSAGNQFTLQPLSVQTQTGLNVAGGIGSIKLEYVQ